MKHIFSETGDIARANRRRHGSNYNLNNWTKSTKPNPSAVVIEKKAIPLKTHCRECGCILEKKASKIWGICPMCDMK